MTRSHFVDISFIDIQKLRERVEYMYIKTIRGIRTKHKQCCSKAKTTKDPKKLRSLTFIHIPKLRDLHTQLRDTEFMDYFINWTMKVMSKIFLKSTIGHTIDCIVRATFDLVFRYAIDIDCVPVNLGNSKCDDLVKLQFSIFSDNLWYLRP